MAEAVLRRRMEQEGLTDWHVESAGTWTVGGSPSSSDAIQVMAEQGLDLAAHRSRAVDRQMMARADLVLVMTQSHAEVLNLEFADQSEKVFLLSEMKDGRRYDIDDPYGRSRAEYLACANTIIDLIDEGWERIRSLAQQNARAEHYARPNNEGS
jgi:protein-tyrosine-phosphatase